MWRFVIVGALAAALAACGSSPSGQPDGGQHNPPPEEDAGRVDVDAGTPGPITAEATVGAYVQSPTRTVLTGTKVAIFGTQPMLQDPTYFGRPATDDKTQWLLGGLIALDTETGAARVYTKDNGLPTAHITDKFHDYGYATAPIFDLTWITPDTVFAAAGWDSVTVGTIAEDGSITFRSTHVKAPQMPENANVAHVAYAGGELFASTNQGLAVLDPATLAIKRWIDFSSTTVWANQLSVGTLDGRQVVGLLLGPAEQPSTKVAILHPGDTTPTVFSFSDGSMPTAIYGMNGNLLVGAITSDHRGAIYAIGPAIDGLAMDVMVTADTLSSMPSGPVIPNAMAWDEAQQTLIVGGQATNFGGMGLVRLAGSPDGSIWGSPEPVIPADDKYQPLLPYILDQLAFDPQGRLYLVGRQICDEQKLRQLPVYRLERDPMGSYKLVRPLISGVRDLEVDSEGNTWLALRDADPGMQCFAANVGVNVCRLRADGACEIVPDEVTDSSFQLGGPLGTNDIAFGRADHKEIAYASRGEATWVRQGDTEQLVATQSDPLLSLAMNAAAWSEDGTLWLASQQEWSTEDGLDEELVNRRSPHSVGFIELDGKGNVTASRRYVRKLADVNVEEVEGMPSDSAWAVLPLPGHRRALVALGADRYPGNYDHILGDKAPVNTTGGVVLIDDETVTPFAAPEGQSFGEVVALAEQGEDFYAVDDGIGVIKLDLVHHTVSVVAAPMWTADERPLSLAVDAQGHLAVGTTQGLYLIAADQTVFHAFGDRVHGYVWRLRFMEDGVLYAGTDDGLVRMALDDATLPASIGPASYATRTIWPIEPSCGGVDGCVCKEDLDCAKGYSCLCNGNGCFCQMDPALCAGDACACSDDGDCPGGWYCDNVPGVGACREKQACDATCTCETSTGCSEDLSCQSGIGGQVCG